MKRGRDGIVYRRGGTWEVRKRKREGGKRRKEGRGEGGRESTIYYAFWDRSPKA